MTRTTSESSGGVSDGDEPDKLRMADLVAATGVPKSTILYYVSEGLLPEPERPKPNVALYDPVCVDLIRYIRGAQQLHRYPLSLIRRNVDYILRGASAEEILLLGKRILGEPKELHSLDQATELCGVEQGEVERFVSLGLVWPTQTGEYDEFDLRMIRLLARVEEVGIPAEAFKRVAEALRQVEEESSIIAREHVDASGSTERASVLVDVLGRLQPYLVRRYFERRTS